MSSSTPTPTSGIVSRLREIWADMSYAQLRAIEHNRPRRTR